MKFKIAWNEAIDAILNISYTCVNVSHKFTYSCFYLLYRTLVLPKNILRLHPVYLLVYVYYKRMFCCRVIVRACDCVAMIHLQSTHAVKLSCHTHCTFVSLSLVVLLDPWKMYLSATQGMGTGYGWLTPRNLYFGYSPGLCGWKENLADVDTRRNYCTSDSLLHNT